MTTEGSGCICLHHSLAAYATEQRTQNESEYLEVSMLEAYPTKTWQPQQQQVIKKEMDALTAAEQLQHGAELEKARASELGK
eukprot:4594287-Amphidinium_carterae.1